jgi:hypothetical protein
MSEGYATEARDSAEEGAEGAMRRLHEIIGYFEEQLEGLVSQIRPILRPTNPSPLTELTAKGTERSEHHETVRAAIGRKAPKR